MALKLGTVYAEARLDTGGFRRGVSEISGMVGTINTSLGSISGLGMGAAVAVGVASAIAELAKLPQEALKLNADFEKIGIGISTTLQQSAAFVPPSYEAMGAQITAAVRKEAEKVEEIAQEMAESVADHAQAAARSIAAVAKAGEDRDRGNAGVARRTDRFNIDEQIGGARRLEDFNRASVRREENFTRQINETVVQRTRVIEEAGLSQEKASSGNARSVRNINQRAVDAEKSHNRKIRDLNKQRASLAKSVGKATSGASDETAKKAADAARQFAERTEDIGRNMSRATEDYQHDLKKRNDDFGRANIELNEKHNEAVNELNEQAASIVKRGAENTRGILFQVSQQMTQLLGEQLNEMAGFSQQLEDLSNRQFQNARNNFESVRVAHERSLEDFRNAIHDQDQRLLDQGDIIKDNLDERLDSIKDIADAGKRQAAYDKAVNDATKQRARLEQDVAREKQRTELAAKREAEDFAKQQDAQIAADAAKAGEDAKEKLRLETRHALALKGITDQMQATKAQADFAIAQNQREQQDALAQVAKRLAQENREYGKQSKELARKFAEDNAEAKRAYDRRMDDLQRELDREKKAYARQQAEIAAESKKGAQDAADDAAERAADIEQALQDENEDYADQQKQIAQALRDQAEDYERTRSDIARSLGQRLDDFNTHVDDLKAARDREVEDALLGYQRQEEDSRRRAEREREDVAESLDEIARRYKETIEGIAEQWGDEETRFERQQRKQAKDYEEAQNALTDARKKANDQAEAATRPFMLRFTQGWVDAMNTVQQATERKYTFNFTDDTKEQREQLLQWVDELGSTLPGSTLDATKAMNKFLEFGIDPTMRGVKDSTVTILELASALATKPGVEGGIDQIVRAFGAGATGQVSEMNQRFREMGIVIENLPGVTKTATGEIKQSAQELFKIILDNMGPEAKTLLENYRGSWEFLVSNLQDAGQRLLKAIGKEAFEGSKAALTDFTGFLDNNKDRLAQVAKVLGDAFAGVVKGATDFAKQVFTPETLTAIGNLLTALGNLKDGAVNLEQTFERGLFGGKTIAERIFGPTGEASVEDRASAVNSAIDSLANGDINGAITKFNDIGISTDRVIEAWRAINDNDGPGIQKTFAALGLDASALVDENGNLKVSSEEASSALVDGLASMAKPLGDTRNNFSNLVESAAKFVEWLTELANSEEAKTQVEETAKSLQQLKDFLGEATVKGRDFAQVLADYANSPGGQAMKSLAEDTGKAVDQILKLIGELIKLRSNINDFTNKGGVVGAIGRRLFGDKGSEQGAQDAEQVNKLVSSMEMAERVARELAAPVDQVQAAIARLADASPDGTFSVKELGEAIKGIDPTLRQSNDAIDAWAKQVEAVLVSGMDDTIGGKAREPWRKLATNIESDLHDIHGGSVIDDWLEELGNWFPAAMADALDDVVDVGFEDMEPDATDKLDEVQAAFESFASDLRDKSSKDIADSVKELSTVINDSLGEVAEQTPESLKQVTESFKTLEDGVHDVLEKMFNGIADKVKPDLDLLVKAIEEQLHRIHGSGLLVPWIEATHDTMVDGVRAIFYDAASSADGLADAIGNQLSAASIEVSLFVDSLDEAANEVREDMANIKKSTAGGGEGGGAGMKLSAGNLFNSDRENDAIRERQAEAIKGEEQRAKDADKRNQDEAKKQEEADKKRLEENEKKREEGRKKDQEEADRQREADKKAQEEAARAAKESKEPKTPEEALDAAKRANEQGGQAAGAIREAANAQTAATQEQSNQWASIFSQLQRSQLLGGSIESQLTGESKAAIDAAVQLAATAPSGAANAIQMGAHSLIDAAETIAGTQQGAGIGAQASQTNNINTGNILVKDAGIGFMGEWLDGLTEQLRV